MKNFLLAFSCIFFSSTVVNAGLIYVPVSTENSKKEFVTFYDAIQKMDAKTFLSLRPLKVKEITGKRMSIKEKVVLKLAQREVKKKIKKDKGFHVNEVMLNANGTFDWGAYLLGVFLLLIGVIIVYVTNWEDPQVARKSAWRGLLTGLLIASAIIGALAGI
jgi:hypothetical protein